MAGEVIALGEGVTDWKVGDRVCANFATDHVYGDTNFNIQQTSMGGQAHGCLTQYRTFPAHVRMRPSTERDSSLTDAQIVACQVPRVLEL